MDDKIVVIGTGYAGTRAVQQLERNYSGTNITWIGENQYHLILHETHRVIRDPVAQNKITISVDDVKEPNTRFIKGRVTGIDTEAQLIKLADQTTVDYDYVLVAIGSQTAYYGIPGLAEHAYTLKSLDDALTIHEQVRDAADTKQHNNPAHIVIGGAGLSGVQIAGEIAELRDKEGLPIEISLLEATPEILPGQNSDLQQSVRRQLSRTNITVQTDDPIAEATDEQVHLDSENKLSYDVLIWAGGITGHNIMDGVEIETEHNRIVADTTFQTSNRHVFTVGDAAVIEDAGNPVPPTAQAAWQAADVAAGNIIRAIHGKPLQSWEYDDKGTLISIGDKAIAHNVPIVPVNTFGSYPAQFLKKLVAARWIAGLTSWKHALSVWDAL